MIYYILLLIYCKYSAVRIAVVWRHYHYNTLLDRIRVDSTKLSQVHSSCMKP